MKPGQHYYDHLPQRIREEFSHCCNTRMSYVLTQKYESLAHMIDESFSTYFSPQGKDYWTHVIQTYQPGLKTKIIVFVEKHAWKSTISLLAVAIASLIISYCTVSNSAENVKLKDKQLIELDSAYSTVRKTDSLRMTKAIWMPDTSAIKGAIMTSEEWMDSNPMKQ